MNLLRNDWSDVTNHDISLSHSFLLSGAKPKISDDNGNRTLKRPCNDMNRNIVKLLIEKGADAGPLVEDSIDQENIKKLKFLFSSGADPNLKNYMLMAMRKA